MTGRGRAGNPLPPLLPPRDPTLETRPVPRERLFTVQSFGPGASPDIRSEVQSIKELRASVESETGVENHGSLAELLGRVEVAEISETHFEDPTWGFYVFVTSYTTDAIENLAPAMSTVVETMRRTIFSWGHPALAAETYKRFKLDVIQDKEALEDASDDRIREEFSSFIRGLGLWDEEEYEGFPSGPFDLGLSLPDDDDDDEDNYKAFKSVGIKILDRVWRRPASGRMHYPGVDICPIKDLPLLYRDTSMGDSGAIEDLYPLYKWYYPFEEFEVR
ncbi:hypothetical protein FSARC_9221 [Fusarium sarcochroum]|uniref:Uncharacterized protein n=1 Tax=Fusarium sarcochroum TaxID=1208366 RepID=A0A8H4X613_9HYPO|nr:hypothetical protein FSARC_9221 [Fusarium sarcochroum]